MKSPKAAKVREYIEDCADCRRERKKPRAPVEEPPVELSRERLGRINEIANRPTIYSKQAVVEALRSLLAASRGVAKSQ